MSAPRKALPPVPAPRRTWPPEPLRPPQGEVGSPPPRPAEGEAGLPTSLAALSLPVPALRRALPSPHAPGAAQPLSAQVPLTTAPPAGSLLAPASMVWRQRDPFWSQPLRDHLRLQLQPGRLRAPATARNAQVMVRAVWGTHWTDQSKAITENLILCCSLFNKMLWFIVSKAALRSNRTRMVSNEVHCLMP